MTFDSLGRLVTLDSPDSGRTEWLYDRTANLGAKQTARLRAKNQLVRYERTFNRVDRIDYPTTADVTYVYGIPAQVPIEETHPTDPTCSYGIGKLAIEKYLALNARLHGMDYVVLRVANPMVEPLMLLTSLVQTAARISPGSGE